MDLQFKLALEGNLGDFAHQTHLRIAVGARTAAEKMAARAKLALREDTRRGGLGDKLANAWRADIYPQRSSVRTHSPAVQVYTKAPKIMQAFAQSTVISAVNARYLAIPTENTPRRGRRYATPVEVEIIYNQDLTLIHGKGQQILAFVNAVKSKNGKKWRRATKTRTGKQNRKAELVLMFVMVRQVHLRKRVDYPQIFDDLKDDWSTLFPTEIAAALNAGSN